MTEAVAQRCSVKKDEILCSTRFSTTFSTIFENIKISILVPFWATIDHKINFTQNTSHSSFISKKKLLSVADAFRNTHFLPHFYQFSQWMWCAIFQINTNLLLIQRNVNIFTQETLYPSFISKKNWHSLSQTFFETTTFYHFFTIFKSE